MKNQQNINQSETKIGNKKLSMELIRNCQWNCKYKTYQNMLSNNCFQRSQQGRDASENNSFIWF